MHLCLVLYTQSICLLASGYTHTVGWTLSTVLASSISYVALFSLTFLQSVIVHSLCCIDVLYIDRSKMKNKLLYNSRSYLLELSSFIRRRVVAPLDRANNNNSVQKLYVPNRNQTIQIMELAIRAEYALCTWLVQKRKQMYIYNLYRQIERHQTLLSTLRRTPSRSFRFGGHIQATLLPYIICERRERRRRRRNKRMLLSFLLFIERQSTQVFSLPAQDFISYCILYYCIYIVCSHIYTKRAHGVCVCAMPSGGITEIVVGRVSDVSLIEMLALYTSIYGNLIGS